MAYRMGHQSSITSHHCVAYVVSVPHSYCGDPAVGEKVLKPLRTFGTPIADLIQQRPYLEIQSLFDPINPPGRRYYNKAHNISKVNDRAIDTVFHHMAKVPTPNG